MIALIEGVTLAIAWVVAFVCGYVSAAVVALWEGRK